MVLSIGSLICLLVSMSGGLNKNSSTQRSLYYFRTDTSKFKSNSTLLGTPVTGSLLSGLIGQATTNKLYDFYDVYFWNYCAGSLSGNGTETVQYCSPRKNNFVFNPIEVWGLNGTTIQKEIPGGVTKAINAYEKGAHWMWTLYVLAFWITVGTIVVGIFAICSRVGSFVTTIVSSVATVLTFVAALIATILFSALVGGLDTSLKEYNVKSSVGTKVLAVDWLAVAFSIGASAFWLISICCCSGRSNNKDRHSKDVAPSQGFIPFGQSRGYQPLGDEGLQHPNPYGGSGHEMQDFGAAGPYKGRETAYEPFRHA